MPNVLVDVVSSNDTLHNILFHRNLDNLNIKSRLHALAMQAVDSPTLNAYALSIKRTLAVKRILLIKRILSCYQLLLAHAFNNQFLWYFCIHSHARRYNIIFGMQLACAQGRGLHYAIVQHGERLSVDSSTPKVK